MGYNFTESTDADHLHGGCAKPSKESHKESEIIKAQVNAELHRVGLQVFCTMEGCWGCVQKINQAADRSWI